MANKISSSATYINDFIKKKLLPPRDAVIDKISKALNVQPEYFKECGNRRSSGKLNTLDFNKDNYDVPLSQEEIGADIRKNS